MARKPSRGRTSRAQASARQRAQAAAAEAARRRQRRIIILVAVGVLVGAIVAGLAISAYRTSRTPTVSFAPVGPGTPATLQASRPVTVGQGSVTVRLYSDFHCPHCADFETTYGPVLEQALTDDTITLAIYPMSFIDEGSVRAANAFGCAAAAGFGRPYFRALFENTKLEWNAEQLSALGPLVSTQVPAGFAACVSGLQQSAWVASITAQAGVDQVNSTPTVFVADQRVDLTQVSPDALKTLIGDRR